MTKSNTGKISVSLNKENNTKCSCKEKIQYTTALIFLFTGIVMCFMSFFMSKEGDVGSGALTYLGESVAFCSGVFCINIYVRSKVSEAEVRINDKIDRKMRKIDDLVADDNYIDD